SEKEVRNVEIRSIHRRSVPPVVYLHDTVTNRRRRISMKYFIDTHDKNKGSFPAARTHRRAVLRAIRGARGGCEGPRRVRSCRTREFKGRKGILLHVRPGRGIHLQGTCCDQFAVRLYHRGETRDRCRHAYPATSEGADAQGGLTQLRTS